MDILKALRAEAVRLIAFPDFQKAKTHPTHADIVAETHDKYEPRIYNRLEKWLKATHKRLSEKNFDFLIKHFDGLKKSDSSDDVKDTLREVIESAFAGSLSDELLDELEPMIDDLSKLFSSSYEVKVNYKLVDERATKYINENLENMFSQLSDNAAKGIYATISDTLASDDGYSLKDVISRVMDSAFNPSVNGKVYFPSITIDGDNWATMVATTVTSKSASASTKAIAEDAGLETWQWVCNNGACDECEPNDNEIVSIGDSFPSGDEEAPAHPLCRCVVILVKDEIDSIGTDDSNDSDS